MHVFLINALAFDISPFLKGNKHGNGGVVFTRWGKKTCPSNAELVHSGKYA